MDNDKNNLSLYYFDCTHCMEIQSVYVSDDSTIAICPKCSRDIDLTRTGFIELMKFKKAKKKDGNSE